MNWASEISRAVRAGASVTGRSLAITGKVIRRSYNRGALLAYVQTGGNQAVQLTTTPPTQSDLGFVELWLHRTFSLAGLIGLLGSVLANSYRTTVNTIPTLMNLALPADNQLTPVTADTRHFFIRNIVGLPGLLLGVTVGAIGLVGTGTVRTVTNSARSLWQTLLRVTNLALEEKEQFKLPAWPMSLFSIPGLFPGAALGVVGFMGAGVVRLITNSAISLVRLTMHMTNWAANNEQFKFEPGQRSQLSVVLGLPGAVVGIFVGAVGFIGAGAIRILYNSAISLGRVTMDMTTFALENTDPSAPDTDNRSLVSKRLGWPGVVLGMGTGIVGFIGAGAVRILYNSAISLGRVTTAMTAFALGYADSSALNTDNRSRVSKRLGEPGTVFGMVTGVIGFIGAGAIRILYNSAISLGRVTTDMTTFALENADSSAPDTDNRSLVSKRLGWPGMVVGVGTGIVGFIGAGAVRILYNSAISLGRVTTDMTTFALGYTDPSDLDPDNRSLVSKRLGWPGMVVGMGTGVAGFIGVGAVRILYNSAISLARVTTAMTKFALGYADSSALDTDNRSRVSKRLGEPGMVVGMVTGVIGFIGAGAIRVIYNSAISLGRATAAITNLAFEKKHKLFKLDADSRSPVSKGLGLLGTVVAVVPGIAGMVGAVGISIIYNSAVSLGGVTLYMTNFALAEDDKPKIGKDSRSRTAIALGLPGSLAGLPVGVIGFMGAVVVRVITNSVFSLTHTTSRITDLALAEKDQFKHLDTRSWVRWGLGIPGAVLGLITGVIGFTGVGITRIGINVAHGLAKIAVNSQISFLRIARQITNFALPQAKQYTIEPDNRPWPTYLLGIPGLVLGTIAGTFGFIGAGVGEIGINSRLSFVHFSRLLTNIALEDKFNIEANNRSGLATYLLGAPGVVLGAIIGSLGFASALIGRIVINSITTYKDLNGSLWNVAVERAVFDGMKNERKPINRLGFGFLGIVLSTPTAILALSLLISRKLVPLILAIAVSPLVALWRTGSESYKYRHNQLRFSQEENDVVIAAFKNLFASLTPMGQLPEGAHVERAPAGPFYTAGWINNILKSLRKALTFNQQSLTEQLLTLSLNEYRMNKTLSSNISEDASRAVLNSSIRLIQDCQGDSHWITPDSEKEEYKAEIVRVRDYVKGYLARVTRGRIVATAPPQEHTITPTAPPMDAVIPTAPAISEDSDPTEEIPRRLYANDGERLVRLFFQGRYRRASTATDPVELTPDPAAGVGNIR
jgi:hypothetical protein